MAKTFVYKKVNNVIDIGELGSYKPSRKENKEFFGDYMKIKAKSIDEAVSKLSMGRPVRTVATGKVVKIQNMFKM